MNNAKQLKTVNDSNYLTVSEAANTLGIKESAIRNYLYAGKMTTYKFKELTLLSKSEVIGWRKKQRK